MAKFHHFIWLAAMALTLSCNLLTRPAQPLPPSPVATPGPMATLPVVATAPVTLVPETPTFVATSTIAPTTSASVKISVPAQAGWVETGLRVAPGQTLNLIAAGTVNLKSGAPEANSTADGLLPNSCMEADCLAPGETYGALVGRIDNIPFRVGTVLEIPINSGGELFLAVNDASYADNTGNFIVTITVR
jgi:hypothetical protein